MLRLCRLLIIVALVVAILAAVRLGKMMPGLALMAVAAVLYRWVRREGGPGTSHGSARFASLMDAVLRGMVGRRSGVIVGRCSLLDPPTRLDALRCVLSPRMPSAIVLRTFLAAFGRRIDRGLIRIPNMVHALTVAPAGAGKSVAVLIPNLLSYIGSCVVVDPKGELFAATARHRSEVLGQAVYRLDPFGIAGPDSESAKMNPLDFIDAEDPNLITDVRAVADAMVIRTGQETDPHWNDSAVTVIAAVFAFICGCEPARSKRTLSLFRDIVSVRDIFEETKLVMRKIHYLGGVIARASGSLTWLVEKELGSVMSSVQRHTVWMDSPAVATCLSETTVDPRVLLSGRATIYLILPHDKLTTLAPLMRMWLSTILRVVAKGLPSEQNQILFLIDEAAHLGRMQILLDAITYMRGYGMRVWLFFQSIDQIKAVYAENATVILDNMSTRQFFGINAYDTAEMISRQIGEATILVGSRNGGWSRTASSSPGGGPGQTSSSVSGGWSESPAARRLIKPEEFLVMPSSVGVVFHQDMRPMLVEMPRYYADPEFRKDRRSGRHGTGGERGVAFAALAASLVVFIGSLCFAGFSASIVLPDAVLVTRAVPGSTQPRYVPLYVAPTSARPASPMPTAWSFNDWLPSWLTGVERPLPDTRPTPWAFDPEDLPAARADAARTRVAALPRPGAAPPSRRVHLPPGVRPLGSR